MVEKFVKDYSSENGSGAVQAVRLVFSLCYFSRNEAAFYGPLISDVILQNLVG